MSYKLLNTCTTTSNRIQDNDKLEYSANEEDEVVKGIIPVHLKTLNSIVVGVRGGDVAGPRDVICPESTTTSSAHTSSSSSSFSFLFLEGREL